MATTTVHMIGQAHLDPVWLWRWTEGRAEALATSQSAVDRLREYADFHFTRGESQIYQWIEEENPALFAEIVELIRAGRWHVVNGMVIQPDMNIPQGESFVRQVLLGKAYMRAKLGVEPRVAYCVDSFGHAGTLPQILRKCGFDSYVFMRPGAHEKTLPTQTFWWQAPDGSRILTFRITDAYTTRAVDSAQHIERSVAAKPAMLEQTMCFFGVGNHGGGPTKAQIENVQQLATQRNDLAIRFSWPDAYFADIADDTAQLPTVAEELQFHAVGCYSVNSALKRSHRLAECRLLLAERLSVMAKHWTGRLVPQTRFDELWHDLCFNQFHDTLGGSSTKEAEDDAIHTFAGIIANAERMIDDAGRAVATQIDTRLPDQPSGSGSFVLFNPAGQPTTQYVEYEPWTDWSSWEKNGYQLVDEQGQPVPYQITDTHEALTKPLQGITRIIFAAQLPAFGYRVYHFVPNLPKPDLPPEMLVTTTEMENDRLLLRLDPTSGAILSCVEKSSGIELVGAGGWNVAQVLEDKTDTWSHRVPGYTGPMLGQFANAHITIGDQGPLQISLFIERTYELSTWLQQLILRRGSDELLIRNWLNWQGQWRIVKLAFDVATSSPTAVHDVPFGWCERPCNGAEVPTQMWMDVSGPALQQPEQVIGAALLNDGKYSCDVNGSTMRLTVLRCPPYAYHEPHLLGGKARYDWVDQGYQEFTLLLRPHIGDWRSAQIVEKARALNLPIVPITMHAHPGHLPVQGSLLSLDSEEVELSTLKQSEEGSDTIVRLVDRHGRGAQTTLHWLDQACAVALQPFEVATFRLQQQDAQWQLLPCDMLERSQ
ncbi:MAG: glycoside hydrolase family 38 C-terminal domain-containing protein [Caldilineaceae bacterium]